MIDFDAQKREPLTKTITKTTLKTALTNPLWVSRPPFLDENYANVKGVPTAIERGLFKSYSFPVWSTPANQDEELSFRQRVSHSWDRVTHPWFVAITMPTGAEDVGDKYQFQIEWQAADIGEIIPNTTAETLTSEVTIENTDAFYAYIIAFQVDCATLVPGQNIQWRLRRIAATANEVDNEVAVIHWDTRWRRNKLGTESIQGY